jgi:hypothetical protein
MHPPLTEALNSPGTVRKKGVHQFAEQRVEVVVAKRAILRDKIRALLGEPLVRIVPGEPVVGLVPRYALIALTTAQQAVDRPTSVHSLSEQLFGDAAGQVVDPYAPTPRADAILKHASCSMIGGGLATQ